MVIFRFLNVSWDEKFFYVRQVFTQGEHICAIGFVQATFRGKEGIYSPKKLIADIGIPDRDLEQIDGVTDWLKFRDGILEEIDRA